MSQPTVLGGVLKDATTVILDQPSPVTSGRVEVLVPAPPTDQPPKPPLAEFFDQLRERQAARGHVPMTREEIDAVIREEPAGWDERP